MGGEGSGRKKNGSVAKEINKVHSTRQQTNSSSTLQSTMHSDQTTSGYDTHTDQSMLQSSNPAATQLSQSTSAVETPITFSDVNKRSYCWNWFKLSQCESKVKCNLCNEVLQFKTATTGMLNHLQKSKNNFN